MKRPARVLDAWEQRYWKAKPRQKQFQVRQLAWGKYFGSAYDSRMKQATLVPFLRKLDSLGKIGRVIVDAGSGAKTCKEYSVQPVLNEYSTPGVFTPTKGKKVIRVDVGMPFDFRQTGDIVELKADVEQTKPREIYQKKQLIRLAGFFGH
jgi:hypothetical protein